MISIISKPPAYPDISQSKEEFTGIITALTDRLLTFFDQVKYCESRGNHLLCFIGEIGIKGTAAYWIAQQAFIPEDWLEYSRNGTFEVRFVEYLSLIRLNMQRANPTFYGSLGL